MDLHIKNISMIINSMKKVSEKLCIFSSWLIDIKTLLYTITVMCIPDHIYNQPIYIETSVNQYIICQLAIVYCACILHV